VSEGVSQRRLAAILAADVVGYSRLMGLDEAGTLAALKAVRIGLIDPKIAEHIGRIFKTTGDGMLVEFPSVVNAVACAVDIQRGMQERNANVADERAVQLRIGVNLGDVIVEDEDIFGDGVNVAARLERIAPAGGVAVSGTVRDHLGNRLDLRFEDLGEKVLKNIERPVRVHSIAVGEVTAVASAPRIPSAEKPSIAVLPFNNMSGDPEQTYFADGVVEDIITALSRFTSFAVVARNSSFTYRDRAVDVRDVGRALGVRYVLEGSVQRRDKQVRVTAQLVEATTGAHLWAEKFDGKLEEIYAFQDHITEAVACLVEPRILRAEIERARAKRPENLDAYDLFLRALPNFYGVSPDGYVSAIDNLERAIALEPDSPLLLAYAAWAYEKRDTIGLPLLRPTDRQRCVDLARAALRVGGGDPVVQAICGYLLLALAAQKAEGLATVRRAVKANPNSVVVLNYGGLCNVLVGDLEEGVACYRRAIELSPEAPELYEIFAGVGLALLFRGDFDGTIEWELRALATFTEWGPTYWSLAAAYAHLDRMDEASAALANLLLITPTLSLADMQRLALRSDERFAMLISGLRKAGLPET
jgi:TolB-like protein